jgi:hypothetical protein
MRELEEKKLNINFHFDQLLATIVIDRQLIWQFKKESLNDIGKFRI